MNHLDSLVQSIENTHSALQKSAVNAVNQALTIRNWMIGFYIVEFEQNGSVRAEYGENLIQNLALKLAHIKGIDKRSLYKFRQFYLVYSYLTDSILAYIDQTKLSVDAKLGTVSTQLKNTKVGAASTLSAIQTPPSKLLSNLSYSHIELLLNQEEELKRVFYEVECIKNTWSIRELKRQINSLYYERSGISQNPQLLSEIVQNKSIKQNPIDIIKNVYSFDFLEISSKEIVEESELESALIENLQEFILELGNGFCFEARQKRILIGENYYFIDLVFYHRVLKCHILVELKLGAFTHGDIGQLNTYVNYYKKVVSSEDDNPPIGILLVAEKDNALVEFATAGMDENLFIQKYLIQLPTKDLLQNHINKEIINLKR
jgi:predicted nuclease of restriction endonuclease-like (RecB) superfamily